MGTIWIMPKRFESHMSYLDHSIQHWRVSEYTFSVCINVCGLSQAGEITTSDFVTHFADQKSANFSNDPNVQPFAVWRHHGVVLLEMGYLTIPPPIKASLGNYWFVTCPSINAQAMMWIWQGRWLVGSKFLAGTLQNTVCLTKGCV